MFQGLKKYKKIVVTGPQRSGTTFASQAIAHDLGYKHIHESEIKWSSTNLFYQYLLNPSLKCAIHCPCLSGIAHYIDTPETFVVFMKREIKDIIRSQKMLNWQYETQELRKYFVDKGPIAIIKYETWEQFQKPFMRVPYMELEYESLSSHKLWLNPDERVRTRQKTKFAKMI